MAGTPTGAAISEQRLQVLSELALRTADASTASDAGARAAGVLATVAPEIPFALLFLVESDQRLSLAGASGFRDADGTGSQASELAAGPGLWGLDEFVNRADAMVVLDLDDRHRALLSGERVGPTPTSACVLPIRGPGRQIEGYFIAGLPPRQRFTDSKRVFLQLFANGLGATIAALRAAGTELHHQQLLEDIGRSTSTLFNYIGHELRTPLHAILGWAQVLNRDGIDAPQLSRGLDAIERNARAQSRMVDELIALRHGMAAGGHDTAAARAIVPMPVGSTIPATTAPIDDSPMPDLDGLTVLVVDDNADARELVGEVLVEAGANVVAAESSEQGLSLLAQYHPDLIVSDLGMPEADGFSFIRQVRSLDESAGGGTPAVALSALVESADRERALRSGYQMHLAKPAERSELVTVCASLTGRLS